jgi:hypothetical protein
MDNHIKSGNKTDTLTYDELEESSTSIDEAMHQMEIISANMKQEVDMTINHSQDIYKAMSGILHAIVDAFKETKVDKEVEKHATYALHKAAETCK